MKPLENEAWAEVVLSAPLDYAVTGQALLAVARYLQHAEQSDSWRGDADLLVAVLDAECPGWREAFLRVGKIAERLR
jgi:hypothetical protein